MIYTGKGLFGGLRMLKSIICTLIVAVCSYMGYAYGEQFKRRYSNLKELQRAVLQLENEILYSYTSLPVAIDNVGDKSRGAVKEFLKDMASKLKENYFDSVYQIFTSSYEVHKDKLDFKEEDAALLDDLTKSLGEVDIIGHKKIFNLFSETIKGNIEDAEESMKRNQKMYRYLGLCAGLGIVILIV